MTGILANRMKATGKRRGLWHVFALALFVLSGAASAQELTITAPTDGSTSPLGSTISITAVPSGSVSSVQFYQNGAKIGSPDITAPYTKSFIPSATGTYVLTAEGLDGQILIESEPVTVTVVSSNVAPTVSLTSPVNGASATAPATFNLTAGASDSDGTITNVKFYADGTLLSTDTTAPYTGTFTSSVTGAHALTAVATDNGGATTTSAAVSVTVSAASNIAPTVSLTSPANGASAAAPATFNLTASASDSDGSISSVKFYADGSLLSTDTTSPYNGTFTSSAAGAHVLTAVATDNGGATKTSAAVSVTVTGGGGGGAISVSRGYVYDSNHRLCKTIDPEAGATLVDYDAAGNIAWVATGTSLTSNTCDRGSVTTGMKAIRSYDVRNRLTGVTTPGGSANVSTTYTPDGLVASLVAANGPSGANPVTTAYTYNKRRLLETETSAQPTYSYGLIYNYDANGHVLSLQYPDTQVVTYAPDAFGRATEIKSGAQPYASNITYFANGAISGFNYGNGVVHTMTPNARMLPSRSLDSKTVGGVTTTVIDDNYLFDANGNVASITDGNPHNGDNRSRSLAYDGLDRMTKADALYQWGTANYTYDAIDNLRTAQQGPRQFTYTYDSNNRLSSISGTQSFSFGYDPRGNVISKGTQDFTFDPSNRMTTAELLSGTGLQTYRYDGTGRRVQTTDPGGKANLWVYSQAAQVVYNHDERRSQNLSYIYLGNTQVATRTVDYANGGAVAIRFQHTDSLGSPVAETDANGVVVKRDSFAPYGEAYGATSIDGTGYTGHVMDRDTSLTYMQQRYYDPQIGRFLSRDPVQAEFSTYSYASNNPYRFVDPDGRKASSSTDPDDPMNDPNRPNGCGKKRDCTRETDGDWHPGVTRVGGGAGSIDVQVGPSRRAANGATYTYFQQRPITDAEARDIFKASGWVIPAGKAMDEGGRQLAMQMYDHANSFWLPMALLQNIAARAGGGWASAAQTVVSVADSTTRKIPPSQWNYVERYIDSGQGVVGSTGQHFQGDFEAWTQGEYSP